MRGERGVPVRFRFCKRGPVRFISHRDVARAFERAFRIERLPLAFTEGFAPHPRISFGLALATGHESNAEYLDVEMVEEPVLDDLVAGVSAALPEGMDVTDAMFLEPRATSLQQAVTSVSYQVEAFFQHDDGRGPGDVGAWVHDLLAADELPAVLQRKGKEITDDLRPAILDLAVIGTTSSKQTGTGVTLKLEVLTQPRNVRPAEVLAVLGPRTDVRGAVLPAGCVGERNVLRLEQWIERDGSRFSPLEADTRPRTEVGAR